MQNPEIRRKSENDSLSPELDLFYATLNGVRSEVDRLLLLTHDIEEGEEGEEGKNLIEELRRDIKNLPQIVNSFVEKVYHGDREKLQKVLKDDISSYSAHFISSNAEYLSSEVQDWLRMIREGERVVNAEDNKRLKELSLSLKRSFPTGIEKWTQKHIWEGFGRKADYTKLHGMFDVRNHAKRVTKRSCQESV